jgi:hypothetical protein
MHVCYVLPMSTPPTDRYEPLPSLAALPGWLWRRLPKPGRVAVAVLVLAIVAVGLALAPGIEKSKDERARSEELRSARERAARLERIRAEQRPRFAVGVPAPGDLPGRHRLLDQAAAAVRADARARAATHAIKGPIRRVECEPFPRSASGVGAHETLASRYGRYECLAVTAEFRRGEFTEAGTIGHPYRLRIDFGTGRYAFCKVTGRAGELAISATPPVGVPRACGG